MDYPPKPQDRIYTEGFPAIVKPRPVPTEDRDHDIPESTSSIRQDQQRAATLAAPVKIEFGVIKLQVASTDRTSRSESDALKSPEQPEACDDFNYAPGKDEDKLTIKYVLHASADDWQTCIKGVKLDLFARSNPEPVWTGRWGNSWGADGAKPLSELPLALEEKLLVGELAWKDVVKPAPSAACPDGLLTLAGSPYQLRLTVSGCDTPADAPDGDRWAYPSTAWTWVHVLSHSIKLGWGEPDWLDRTRPDIDPAHVERICGKAGGADGAERGVLKRLKDTQTEPKKDVWHEVVVPSDVFARKYDEKLDEKVTDADFKEYAKLWGTGPRVPLAAEILIKGVDGAAATDVSPKVLTGARVLWDWQEPDAGRWKKDATPTPESSNFLETVVEAGRAKHKPASANCPKEYGGKHGDDAAPVFPSDAQLLGAAFPFAVTPCKRRTWAALTEVATTGTHAGKAGIIFQPSRMAGDTYAVSAALYFSDELDTPDALELPDAARGAAGNFEVLRGITVHHVVLGDVPGIDLQGCRDTTKKILRDQARVAVDPQVKAVPKTDLKELFKQGCADARKLERGHKIYACSLGLLLEAALDLDAASTVSPITFRDTADVATKGEALLRNRKLQVVRFDPAPVGDDFPHEGVIGEQRGGKAYPLNYDPKAKTYVLLLEENSADFWDGEKIRGEATGSNRYVRVLDVPICKNLAYEAAEDTAKAAGTISVTFPAGVTHDVVFGKKTFSRKVKTDLDDKQKRALREKLLASIKAFKRQQDQAGARQEFKVRAAGGGPSDDDKARREVITKLIKADLDDKGLIVGLEELVTWAKSLGGPWMASDARNYAQKIQKDLPRDFVLSPSVPRLIKQKQWNDPGVYVLHLSAYSNLAELAKASDVFYTAGVKKSQGVDRYRSTRSMGAYDAAYEFKPKDRSTGLITMCTADPTSTYTEKVKTKPDPEVFAHEVAHAMFLPHAPPATGGALAEVKAEAHTVGSTCLMNYDLESNHFCGMCMLRLRGWDWKKLKNTAGNLEYQVTLTLGDPTTDLFLWDATTPAGKRQRLQVLGLFNRPLDQDVPELDVAWDAAWEHAKTLLPGLEDDPEKVLGDAIKAFLVEGGALPAAGTFAKLRVPGGFTPYYSMSDLIKLYPDHHEGDEPNPEDAYALGAERAALEDKAYAHNPALGAIPLTVKVEERVKGSGAAWKPAPDLDVWVGLAAPDPLPVYAAAVGAGTPVAGAKSFYDQVVAPPLATKPDAFVKKVVDGHKASAGKDPEAGNAHDEMGGLRAGRPEGRVSSPDGPLVGSRRDGFTPIPAGGVEGKAPRGYAVPVRVDDQGVGQLTFRPSRAGGDRYKLEAFVLTTGRQGQEGKTTTGTMVRWRTVRVCRYHQMKPPASTSVLSDEFKRLLVSALESKNQGKQEKDKLTLDAEVARLVKPLVDIDLKGFVTTELAKAYCELLLEPLAEAPSALPDVWDALATEVDRLALAFKTTVNKPSLCKTPVVHRHKLTPTSDARTTFECDLPTKTPAPDTITVRVEGKGLPESIAHDHLPDGAQPPPNGDNLIALNTGDPVLGRDDRKKTGAKVDCSGKVDYATGKVTVTFPAKFTQELEVCYTPDDYLDLPSFSDFKSTSRPGLFKLALPEEYNPRVDGKSFVKMEEGARPRHADFVLDQFYGPPLFLYAGALVQLVGDNKRAFLPGLVLIQADVADTYSALWGGATQEGKGLANGVFVFRPVPSEDNQKGVDQLALHEMSHGLFLMHAPPVRGGRADLHDPADGACVMSYSPDRDGDYCGMCVANLRGLRAHQPPLSRAKPSPDTSWIVIELSDDAGRPQAGAEFEVWVSKDDIRTGQLNEQGKARVDQLPKGKHKVRFPAFHGPEWEKRV